MERAGKQTSARWDDKRPTRRFRVAYVAGPAREIFSVAVVAHSKMLNISSNVTPCSNCISLHRTSQTQASSRDAIIFRKEKKKDGGTRSRPFLFVTEIPNTLCNRYFVFSQRHSRPAYSGGEAHVAYKDL